MPRKPRAYRPKTKGCYECSKRRVSCDRAEPQCQKCSSRGLQCSGLGIRHRFSQGVAARGFWVGKTIQEVYEEVSTHIACEMVAIDGQHNGWRHIVLPMALSERLVLNAVLAASSFHLASWRTGERQAPLLSGHFPPSSSVSPGAVHATSGLRTEPAQMYIRTIMDLKKRDIRPHNREESLVTLLTILILLVTAMVTGSDDFPMLFRLLDSAMEVIGGEGKLGDTELSRFVIRQICKMRVYAAPLLSEDAGVATLSSETNITRAFECLRHCSERRPDFTAEASIIKSLIRQSYDIYLQQARYYALSDSYFCRLPHDMQSIWRVQRFIDTFQSFPSESSGMQVLVWATFVAASACVLDEHRSFFLRVFQSFYARSGFKNLSRGAKHIQRIWNREGSGERWVSLLPKAKVFVM
ncbi:hypothetical protein CPLU01_06718 [Colletotrichum plurivorum]|uniref:Zn(2)-C6 fungal-type domain-containing protein n=1 Tax=Colletotrichum plurivorum TaxID=2175906 RepID=A0A8H6KHP2_9PEZI|nr:hypothetical protein CPLU01_06718 [Colletotrichum plurivorum]